MVWNIPSVSLGQLSWLCPLPTSCLPPAHCSLGEWGEAASVLCEHCLAVAKMLVCYQHLSILVEENLVHRNENCSAQLSWTITPKGWMEWTNKPAGSREGSVKMGVLLKKQWSQPALCLAFPHTFPFNCNLSAARNLSLQKDLALAERNNLRQVSWGCFDNEKRVNNGNT